jgi:hypothetical protein
MSQSQEHSGEQRPSPASSDMADAVTVTQAVLPTPTPTPAPPGPVAAGPATQLTPPNPQLDPVLAAMSQTLQRRGYLTTEWWTAMVGAALSGLLAVVGVQGPAVAQVAGVLAPVAISAVYTVVRTKHKSALASTLVSAFPESSGVSPQSQGSAQV